MLPPPHELFQWYEPLHVSAPGLHARCKVWALARGFTRPRIIIDRMAEGRPGFNALIWHETVHCFERHALTAVIMLLFSCVSFSVGVTLGGYGDVLNGWLAIVLSVAIAVLWATFKREAEARADAYALAAGGGPEFVAFLLMHPHPGGWWWLPRAWNHWKYGANPVERERRARKRAWRIPWAIKPSLASRSKSSPPTAEPSSV